MSVGLGSPSRRDNLRAVRLEAKDAAGIAGRNVGSNPSRSTMGVAEYSNNEMRLYDRLGPKAKAAIGNAHRIIDIAFCLNQFQRGREPVERNGNFYPAPAYNSPDGDAEFARWIEDKVIRKDAKLSLDQLILRPLRTGPVTKRAMRWR